jgi:hypothetical protein
MYIYIHTNTYIYTHTYVHMLPYVRVLKYAPAGLKRIVCKDSETRQLCKSHVRAGSVLRTLLRQYLYFCTSKASKLSTWGGARQGTQPSAHAPPSSHFLLLIRQHTSAYVSIRPHTSAYVMHASAYVSIRQQLLELSDEADCSFRPTPLYADVCIGVGVCIRQQTSAYVSSC